MGSEDSIRGLRLRKINPKLKATTVSTSQEATEEPVTPAGRLFMQPNMNCYILCTLGFADSINVAEFKKTLLVTLVNHKRFQSVIRNDKKGRNIWVPVDVDIDAHVVESTAYSESEMAAPRFVENYVANLALAPPLDASRPMWQCHIINGTSGNAASHMVVRVHHALGDGVSLMSLLLACTRRLNSPDELPAVPVPKKRRKEKQSLFMWLLSVIILLWNTITGVFLFTSTAVWLRDSETVIKGHEGDEKGKKKLVYQIIDLNDMMIVKNAVNGTVNDVLMGMVGSAVQRYLEDRYADTGPAGEPEVNGQREVVKKEITSKVENLRVRACALMNTRASPGLQELASMMDGGSQSRWGNHLGYLVVKIPLKRERDPLDHVRAAKKIGDRKKASLEGIFTYWSGALMMNLTGPIPPTLLTRRIILQATLTVSNVSGPTEPVTFSGNPIVNIFPTVSGHPQALAIHLQSYMGKASLVVMVAEAVIPDPETICQLCVDALRDMVKAAKARGST